MGAEGLFPEIRNLRPGVFVLSTLDIRLMKLGPPFYTAVTGIGRLNDFQRVLFRCGHWGHETKER